MPQRDVAQFTVPYIGITIKTSLAGLGICTNHKWDQLYGDGRRAVGLALCCMQDGSLSRWQLDESATRYCGNGALFWWILHPTTETLIERPDLTGATLLITGD